MTLPLEDGMFARQWTVAFGILVFSENMSENVFGAHSEPFFFFFFLLSSFSWGRLPAEFYLQVLSEVSTQVIP